MTTRVVLAVCQHFLPEAKAIVRQQPEGSITLCPFPSHCERAPLEWAELVPLLLAKAESCDAVCILGSGCVNQLGPPPEELRHCIVESTASCHELVLGADLARELAASRAYVVTPGWLQNWQARLATWGFDKAGLAAFFAESTDRLVLADTGIDGQAKELLRAMAEHVGLLCERMGVGLDLFRARIEKLAAQARLQQAEAQVQEGRRRLADYAMAQDLVCRLAVAPEEPAIVSAFMEVSAILFAPQYVAYLPSEATGTEGLILQPGAAQVDRAELWARLRNMTEKAEWTEGEQGFRLRIGGEEAPVGWMEVGGLRFPQYRNHYRLLAEEMARVFVMALRIARTSENLRQSEQMAVVGQLAGGVAHHINNQLTGILGYAQMLGDAVQGEDHRRYLSNILMGAKRSSEIVQRLLAFSREGKYRTSPVDMHQVIYATRARLAASIDESIALSVELDAEDAVTIGDAGQLQDLVNQVCENAVEAMPSGGELRLTTSTVQLSADEAQAMGVASGRFFRLQVADTGVGISHDMTKLVFRPFFTTKPAGAGVGLGLASAYGTVLNHGGAIAIDSRQGEGATVSIHLPLGGRSQSGEPPPPVTIV